VTPNRDYTDVNNTSTDINNNTEQRLRTLNLPAVNQSIRQTSYNPAFTSRAKLVTPNMCIFN